MMLFIKEFVEKKVRVTASRLITTTTTTATTEQSDNNRNSENNCITKCWI